VRLEGANFDELLVGCDAPEAVAAASLPPGPGPDWSSIGYQDEPPSQG